MSPISQLTTPIPRKTFVFLAGLPASGKDTAANYFKEKKYFLMSYSKDILKPIIEDTNKSLTYYLKQTIPNVSEKEINNAISHIEHLKQTQTGRELYITVGAVYLPELISKLTQNKYAHFNLFATLEYEKYEKIVIAGFRMKEEIETIQTKYPHAKIITILLKSDDNIRYQRIKKRDNLDEKTIKANEKYEKETTYKKIIENIKFDYVIENNSNEKELMSKLKRLSDKESKGLLIT